MIGVINIGCGDHVSSAIRSRLTKRPRIMVTVGSTAGLASGCFMNVHRMLAIGQALYVKMDGNFLDTFVRYLFGECRAPRNAGVCATFDISRGREIGSINGYREAG